MHSPTMRRAPRDRVVVRSVLLAFATVAAAFTVLVAAPASRAEAATNPIPIAHVVPIQPIQPIDNPSKTSGSGASTPNQTSSDSNINLNLKTGQGTSNPLVLVLLLGAVSVIPAILVMFTAFTRIVIVLGFTRTALNTNGVPPNQVIIGLSLFLTLFVMGPVLSAVNHDAIQPYMHNQISASEAYDRGMQPVRGFMLKQVGQHELGLFEKLSGKPEPKDPKDIPTTTLVPAFVLSELRTAFLIGFVIFVPFIVIDLVVAAALSSMGMMMVPPALISLPFKLLLFVAADGWYLVVESLIRSFHG